MSIEAVSWALNTADVKDATEVLILIGIANHAAKDGTGSRAGQATLAHYGRCSVRTVRRKLAALEERGVICRGDQRAAAHIPGNVRPVVWDLVMMPGQNGRAGQNVRPDSAGWPDTGGSEAGHGSVLDGRTRMSYKPLEEPLEEPSELVNAPGPSFADFYAVYPRHAAPADAERAWAKAVKRADPQTIIAGAARYAADPNRDPAFTAFPATWLNRDRWKDEPLPARGRQADRGAGILQAEFLAAQAADAAAVSGYVPGQLAIDGGPR